ncbi:MAG: HAD family hydrolase [Enterococcus sp.]
MIKAVVFDVDDTIYDQQQPFRNAVHQVIPEFKEQDMHQLYIRFRVHSDENFSKVIAGTWTLEYMRSFRINQSLIDLDYSPLTADTALQFQAIYEAELDAITMHDEVRKTLDFLKEQKIPLGIITNGPTDHQTKKVIQLQLHDWVAEKNILISQATGFQKPDPEIFQLAEKSFNFTAEETLYVGDSFENDVIGAKSRNWHALWFNHRHRSLPVGQEALHDLELTHFEQLLPAIKNFFK